MTFGVNSKNIIGLSIAFLCLALLFAFLNGRKVASLRENVTSVTAAKDEVVRRHAAEEKAMKAREAEAVAAVAKATEEETKAASAQSDLAQLQKEKSDLQNKLEAAHSDISSLQSKIDEATAKQPENPGAPSVTELQAQLDEARHQLESAERENSFLSEKIRVAEERSDRLQEERKRTGSSGGKAGLRGTVLAVNQAYNFVVLNLGGRQGVEPNAEMLVLRDGTLIGKIRVSSVEPSTAIGDIITSSLARGVEVQPGDIVVYAGTNS
jgi:hypothetical protein